MRHLALLCLALLCAVAGGSKIPQDDSTPHNDDAMVERFAALREALSDPATPSAERARVEEALARTLSSREIPFGGRAAEEAPAAEEPGDHQQESSASLSDGSDAAAAKASNDDEDEHDAADASLCRFDPGAPVCDFISLGSERCCQAVVTVVRFMGLFDDVAAGPGLAERCRGHPDRSSLANEEAKIRNVESCLDLPVRHLCGAGVSRGMHCTTP